MPSAVPWLRFNPKLLYVDELEFVVHLLFINVTEERHVVPFDFLYKSFFRTPMALREYGFTVRLGERRFCARGPDASRRMSHCFNIPFLSLTRRT